MKIDLSVDLSSRAKTAIHNALNENNQVHTIPELTIEYGNGLSEYIGDSIDIDVTLRIPCKLNSALASDEFNILK